MKKVYDKMVINVDEGVDVNLCPVCQADKSRLDRLDGQFSNAGKCYTHIKWCLNCTTKINFNHEVKLNNVDFELSEKLNGMLIAINAIYDSYQDEYTFEWDDVKDDFREHLLASVVNIAEEEVPKHEQEFLARYINSLFKVEEEDE